MSMWQQAGLEEFRVRTKQLIERADAAGKAIVVKSAALVIHNAQENFEGSHYEWEPHVGGDKPNIVTGATRRSIKMDPVTRYGLGTWGTRVAPRVAWGRRLELGYNGGMGYPYFQPAVEKAQPKFPEISREFWATATRH